MSSVNLDASSDARDERGRADEAHAVLILRESMMLDAGHTRTMGGCRANGDVSAWQTAYGSADRSASSRRLKWGVVATVPAFSTAQY